MRVSFIIPAYNASAYIGRCLSSILDLGLSDDSFEVIIIDDASVDDTVSVAARFCRDHGMINATILHQSENHRQGAARNLGIGCARGEFVVFLDSDDCIAKGLVDALELSERNALEMCCFRVDSLTEEGLIVTRTMELAFSGADVFSGRNLQTDSPYWFDGPVAYLYRRSFIMSVGYPFAEDVFYEDSDFVQAHLAQANRMMYSPACAYKVYVNPSSTTHTISFKHVADYYLLGTRMLALWSAIDEKDSPYALSILEGGSFNIYKAFRRLYMLHSRREVVAFYDRIDQRANRQDYYGYSDPAYCWNWWTRFCLRHKKCTIATIWCMWPIIKLIKK